MIDRILLHSTNGTAITAAPRPRSHGYPPDWVPIQIYVPREFRTRLHVQAAQEGVAARTIMVTGIEAELNRRETTTP